ncbi:MAG TPA: hypothetical protein ACHBZ9_01075 [Arsenophonus nasoniae]|uniref:rolling circle replication-associated protein n=1 Tax=Arsenophonus nasoniae TaxID=638 RepID=UPI00387931DC
MSCYKPITGYRSKAGRNENGAWPIVFSSDKGYLDMPVEVPCGQCIGCRLERSRQWAVRCMHEASLHEDNCFITLTYDEEHLDDHASLNKRDFQLFMKRLRKRFGEGIRYFHCGEYGELLQRPHYHACLFNFDFPDKTLWTVRNGVRLYRSEALEELWPFGYSSIGSVTFDSAAYVARYITKKITGDNADEYYQGREPEYITMSRKPGIGAKWLEKYTEDVYPLDKVVLQTSKGAKLAKPPRYYDKIYDLSNPSEFERIRAKRVRKASVHSEDNTYERLAVREKVHQLRSKQLIRSYEQNSR